MALSQDKILEELHKVVDPELFVNIVDLGLVYKVDITPMTEATPPEVPPEQSEPAGSEPAGSGETVVSATGSEPEPGQSQSSPQAETKYRVRIEMTMTSPMCPAGPQLISGCKYVLSQLPEVGDVEVKIVLDPPWTPDRMTEAARDQLGIF
ncbi:MAG: hypothetical protein KatS3mg110_4130 [Pirellulaceae bacterium]|nr:MAG: hypothetical protein KatS3mg110_4130 [Pirellulaceae bacterium]